jgi:hypothetical protein
LDNPQTRENKAVDNSGCEQGNDRLSDGAKVVSLPIRLLPRIDNPKRPRDPNLLARSVVEDLIGEKWDGTPLERPPVRRFTRLTNAFSKKIENHVASVALYMLAYNFHRKHLTLGTTPAVKAGIADHVWSVEEIVGLLERREQQAA